MRQEYDIAIIGGGMVGATLAVALSKKTTLSIALIESQDISPLSHEAPFDNRVSALTKTSEKILQHLGIWQKLPDKRITAFTDMTVWEDKDSELNFSSADMGETSLGTIIENTYLQHTAFSLCQECANIDVMYPMSAIALEDGDLTLDDGSIVKASLVVAADGANSVIKEMSAIETKGWSYKQKGIVCTVSTEKSHQFTAWQRFLPQGPLAFLPLPDPKQCSIVWSVNDNNAERLLALSDQAFGAELESHFEERLGNIISIRGRQAFPLQLRHASQYYQQGVALVGDAAHTIHPLAGQGVNIGLLDAMSLVDVIFNAKDKNQDLGHISVLQRYQRHRRADNLLMQFSMDLFNRVFRSQILPVKWLRKTALSAVSRQRLLRNLFMQHAASRPFAQPNLINTNKASPHSDLANNQI
ncbi:MAG TPA: FAD-binding protein [Methylophaga aminisulfidivorans]|uniref:FAD-binding protein n=1 Tax=Methylophaga aminisulfidivorans TaxID=230105 RepID=A0A7C1VRE1_9GAMM|nr:FAD-binding protein [Methylophaga aminisulfidivorans]